MLVVDGSLDYQNKINKLQAKRKQEAKTAERKLQNVKIALSFEEKKRMQIDQIKSRLKSHMNNEFRKRVDRIQRTFTIETKYLMEQNKQLQKQIYHEKDKNRKFEWTITSLESLIIEMKAFINNVVAYFTREIHKKKPKVSKATLEQKVMLQIRKEESFDVFMKHRAFRFYNTVQQLKLGTEQFEEPAPIEDDDEAILNYEAIMAEMKTLKTM